MYQSSVYGSFSGFSNAVNFEKFMSAKESTMRAKNMSLQTRAGQNKYTVSTMIYAGISDNPCVHSHIISIRCETSAFNSPVSISLSNNRPQTRRPEKSDYKSAMILTKIKIFKNSINRESHVKRFIRCSFFIGLDAKCDVFFQI